MDNLMCNCLNSDYVSHRYAISLSNKCLWQQTYQQWLQKNLQNLCILNHTKYQHGDGEQCTFLTLASEIWAIDKCKSPGKLIVHHWKAIQRQYMLWANGLVPCHLYCIALIKRWLASSQAGSIDKNYGLTPDASINKKPEIIGQVIYN